MRYLIGVDPGTNTGIALWDKKRRVFLQIDTCGIVDAMADVLLFAKDDAEVWIEDARLCIWPGRGGAGKLQGVGSVKRDCSIWQEFCEHHNLPYMLIDPRHNRTKMKSPTFAKLTGWTERTNEHGRDAAMLVYGV